MLPSSFKLPSQTNVMEPSEQEAVVLYNFLAITAIILAQLGYVLNWDFIPEKDCCFNISINKFLLSERKKFKGSNFKQMSKNASSLCL